MKKFKRVFFFLIIFSIVISCCKLVTFAEEESTTISQDKAITIALFYYYGNTQDEVSIDSYSITPLYDELGQISYYCFDFFKSDIEKGYVLISTDISFTLCPEISYEGASDYYKEFLNNKETIYLNPYSVFNKTKETRRSQSQYFKQGKEISKNEVTGQKISGNKEINKKIRDAVTNGAVPTTNGGKAVFEEDPVIWLRNLGHLNAECSTFGTIETQMRNAGAFNQMYSFNSNIGKTFNGGLTLYNLDHCFITAMANVMRYWRPICCPNYPANYDDLFETLCKKARDLGYFDPSFKTTTSSHSYYNGSSTRVLLDVNSAYSYTGKTYVAQNSWSFLTKYIKNYSWPVILSFEEAELGGSFAYVNHAVVAFGYTIMNTDTFGVNAILFSITQGCMNTGMAKC